MSTGPDILTIGHSNHSWDVFLDLLRSAGATALADVRTRPFSAYSPQFSRPAVGEALRRSQIAYVFMGEALGGRPESPELFRDGVADYEKMAEQPSFKAGLRRVLDGARRYRIALMCSEADPLDCHRCLLVGRSLAGMGAAVGHILASGAVEPHREAEERLLELTRRSADDLFASRDERLAMAYRERGRKVAFAESEGDSDKPAGTLGA